MSAWRDDAACKGQTDLFYVSGRSPNHRPALAICATCPVKKPCLDEAMAEERETGDRFGVRGGKTALERAKLAGTTLRTCEICEVQFVNSRPAKTCSPRCNRVRVALYMRGWQQTYRNTNRPSPIKHGNRHGTSSFAAKSGCKCVVCRNRRRTDNRIRSIKEQARRAA